MSLQPSASSTKRLLQCSAGYSYEEPKAETEAYANGEVAVEEADEPARYGSAFHELLAKAPLEVGKKFTDAKSVKKAARKWNVDGQELAEHIRGALPVLQRWLAGKNPWEQKFDLSLISREEAYAWDPSVDQTRPIELPRVEDHFYKDLRSQEIAMTGDLEFGDWNEHLVMDHKTGEDDDHFTRPEKNRQLRTLASAATTERRSRVAIFHAYRRGLPVIYAEEITAAEKERHRKRVKKSLSLIGSGYLRAFTKTPEDSECKYCPLKTSCPTQTAEILTGAASLMGAATALATLPKGGLATDEDVGRIHEFFSEMDRLKKLADPHIRKRVREALLQKRFISRPGGKVLLFEQRKYERLSKESIRKALGRIKAEELFRMLREAGALEVVEREELHARLPR